MFEPAGLPEPEFISIEEARDKAFGEFVKTGGSVTVADQFEGPIYVQDETAGIAVYSHEDMDEVFDLNIAIGDSIVVEGPRGQFWGQQQISDPELVDITVYPDEGRIIEPESINLSELNSDAYQGKLIQIDNVTFEEQGQFAGDQTYNLHKNSRESILYVNESTDIPDTDIPANESQVTGVASFFDEDPQIQPRFKQDILPVHEVTFRVDLSYQVENRQFQPHAGDDVELRGGFNDWGPFDNGETLPFGDGKYILDHVGDHIYETTVSIAGEAGEEIEYKFRIQPGDGRTMPNEGWEVMDSDDLVYNRTVELESADEPQELPEAYFHGVEDTHLPVSVANLNNYGELEHLNQLFDQPFIDMPTRFEAVIVSHPSNSGLSTLDANGEVRRIHVYVVDTEAQQEGKDGMYMQLVAIGQAQEDLLQMSRGDVIDVRGALTFFDYQAQYNPQQVNRIGEVGEGEFADYESLLEPITVELAELNQNDRDAYEVNLETYSRLINSYVKVEGVSVYKSSPGEIGYPTMAISDGESFAYQRAVSLRYRNDKEDYPSNYNYRRKEDGTYEPPHERSIINQRGFLGIHDLDPFNKVVDNSMIISPWDDGVLWAEDNGEFVRTEPEGWPVDQEVLLEPVTSISPADGTSDLATSLTLSWKEAFGASHYILQVATDPEFDSIFAEEEQLADAGHDITDLEYDTEYHWRVRSVSDAGMTDWTEGSFTTMEYPFEEPEAPQLAEPEDDLADLPVPLMLHWHPVDLAENYELQVATDREFDNVLELSDSGSQQDLQTGDQQKTDSQDWTIAREVSELDYSTRYFWRVKASNEAGESDWSDIRTFTTAAAPVEGTVVLTSPEDESSDLLPPIDLEWEEFEGAGHYDLELSRSAAFDSTRTIREIEQTGYEVRVLADTTTYHWRVRAIVEGERTAWSDHRIFETGSTETEGPELVGPADEADEVSIPVELSWDELDGASTYEVEVSHTPAFDTSLVVKNYEGTTAEIDKVVTDTTTFFWRVRAEVDEQLTAWSTTWSFTTELRPPEVPEWQPEDGSDDVETDLLVEWSVAERAETYHLQLAEDEDFDELIVDEEGLEATEFQASDLEPNTTYHWRVEAANQAGGSGWSESLSFTTDDAVSAEAEAGVPDEFALHNNYPNPFNPETQISYELPEQAQVRLQVYNVLGEHVTTLVNQTQSAGRYEVSFDASELSSGTYIYRIEAGEFVESATMMLVK